MGGFDFDKKGNVVINPETPMITERRYPINDNLLNTMQNIEGFKFKTEFKNPFDRDIIKTQSPKERMQIYNKYKDNVKVLNNSKYIKAIESVPRFKNFKTALVTGGAGAGALAASVASADDLPPGILPQGSPGQINQKQTEAGVPAEAVAAGAAVTSKYTPQILNFLKNVGKGTFKTVASPFIGGTLATTEMLSDDPSLSVAGADLLFPEIIRQVKGKVKPVQKGFDKFLALTPNLKYAPYISKGMSGIGATMIGADILQGLDKRIGLEQRGPLTEQELLDMREKETYMGGIADLFDKAYREGTPLPSRTGFADGPEDPSKRKFMKIAGGLASLPLVGRFFDVAQMAEKAAPAVAKTLKGAPEWFGALVDKVIQKGTDMTKSLGFKDRQEVYGTKIGDNEMVIVYRDLDTGNIKVEYQSPENMGESD